MVVVVLCISAVITQDDFGGGDDAGGADMDLESIMGGDSAGGNNKNTAQVNPVKEKSFTEESILALKQLGVIVGVAFMVGSLFMLMVGVEILRGKLEEKYQKMTGKSPQLETD